eukprot:3697995-Ditylum_brightwellii.AAC.1
MVVDGITSGRIGGGGSGKDKETITSAQICGSSRATIAIFSCCHELGSGGGDKEPILKFSLRVGSRGVKAHLVIGLNS